MKISNPKEQKSSIIRLFIQLGDPVGKSLDHIQSVIGESDRKYSGDPLRCLPDSLSLVWYFENRAVTMYFDSDGICFGADYDHIILPFGENMLSNRDMLDLLENFI